MHGKKTLRAKGVDWSKASFVIGRRADLLPEDRRKSAFYRECAECETATFTEIEYPLDVPIVCNKCASQIAAMIEQDPETLLLYDLPDHVKIRLLEIARERRLPLEEVCIRYLEQELG